jgi:hypothetical protein
MGLDDYVIACRSYKRASTFPQKTYRMLAHNNLTDRLYIFVADEDEKRLYEDSLKGLTYKKIIVGKKGGANATRAICNYFPKNQRILFVDDDLARFFNFTESGEFVKDATNLSRYIEDGFDSIDRWALGAFTFSFLSNKFYLQGKAFKEFRPFMLAGNFFGARNDPEIITTKLSHNDDAVRSVRYFENYGGILVYWWAGFVTAYGQEEGGLQASGSRGMASETLRKTKEASNQIYAEDTLIQAYALPPKPEKKNPFVTIKFKTLPQIRKAQRERKTPVRSAKWFSWWHKKPTEANPEFPYPEAKD